MAIIKKLFITLFIGKKNVKYLNKYLLLILVIYFPIKIVEDYFRGTATNLYAISNFLIIRVVVILIFFRFFIKIYEGIQKFWMKVLKL